LGAFLQVTTGVAPTPWRFLLPEKEKREKKKKKRKENVPVRSFLFQEECRNSFSTLLSGEGKGKRGEMKDGSLSPWYPGRFSSFAPSYCSRSSAPTTREKKKNRRPSAGTRSTLSSREKQKKGERAARLRNVEPESVRRPANSVFTNPGEEKKGKNKKGVGRDLDQQLH